MNLKTILSSAAVALALMAPAHAADVTLRYAFQNPESHPLAMAAKKFADVLAEKTNSSVTVQLFPGAQLGPVGDVIQNLQIGAIDMTLAKPGHLSTLGATAFDAFSLPFIFKDQAHEDRVLNGEIGHELLNGLSNIQLHGVGYLLDSPRHFFFTKKEVKSPADMAGQKIRSLEAAVAVDLIESLGASATPMAFSELYGALQSGIVDGGDQPIGGFYGQRYQEVAKFITLTGHDAAPTIILMSQQAWDKLDDAQKAAVGEAHAAAAEFFLSFEASENLRILGELETAGVTITQVSDFAPWLEAVQPMIDKYGAANADLIARVNALR